MKPLLLTLLGAATLFGQGRLRITTESLPDGTVGVLYSAGIATQGGQPPLRWDVSSGDLPPGLVLGDTGTISGTPLRAGRYGFQIRVRDDKDSDRQSFSLAILVPPTIVTEGLAGGTVGMPYSAALSASGGAPPYTWTATGLPSGLLVNGANIQGIPLEAGGFTVQVRVADAAGGTAHRDLPLAVAAPVAPPSITTDSLPMATAGLAYSATVQAAGGAPPLRWSAQGLPPGLSIGESNGRITGTPSEPGLFNVEVRATDALDRPGARTLPLTVIAPLAVVQASPPAATVGGDYSFQLQGSGGRAPYTWAIGGGSLPPGLTLNASAGTIAGRPTTAGDYSFTVRLTDADARAATTALSLRVAAALTIVSPSPLPAAAVGTDYTYTFAASGGTGPYTWVVPGQLAPGLSLNPSSGLLSGRPTQSGNFTFAIRVTDAASVSVSKDFALAVASALSITNDDPLPGGSVGAPYSVTLSAVSGTSPYTWAVADGSLPTGLVLAPGGGISGTPSQDGTFRFSVLVRDALGATATKALTIVISSELRITTAAALPAAAVGQSYSQRLLVTGGAAPYRWQVAAGSLAPGVGLNTNTGDLSGMPTTAGSYQFTMRVIDARNATTAQAMQLLVTLEGLPLLQMTGLPETAASLEQRAITARLNGNTTVALTGRLTLFFEPDAAVPADDPAIQFSTGGRTVDFTVPANSSQPNLPATLALQTGSVAGLITVQATLGTGGTPSAAGTWTVRVPRAAPVIRSVRLVRTTGGFEVWVTGHSNTRDLGQATFDFQQGSSALQTTQSRQDYAAPARQWFQDQASRVFGGQFTIIQPFTLTGDQGAVAGVTATLANSAGASRPVPVQF